MKSRGLLSTLLFVAAASSAQAAVLASYTIDRDFGGNSAFFTGTFLLQDALFSCDPEICNSRRRRC